MAPFRFVRTLPLVLMSLSSPGWAQAVITPPTLNFGDDKGGTPEGTYCRPPQRRTDSRLPGPEVCKTIREWNALHAAGLDIAPDGISTVPIQKNMDMLAH